MGINISSSKIVTLDDTHQKRVDTSIESNPTFDHVADLAVHYIFRRNKTGDLDRDGSPLLYAMKGIRGYKISSEDRAGAFKRAAEIIPRCIEGAHADYVVPVPSNYTLSGDIAQIVSRVSGIPMLPADFMRKKTVAEMLACHEGKVPTGLSPRNDKAFKDQLFAWKRMVPGQMVSMKEIDTKIRPLFDPLVAVGHLTHLEGRRIIIVDDLMSSGASIASAARVLGGLPNCSVERGICFLSKL